MNILEILAKILSVPVLFTAGKVSTVNISPTVHVAKDSLRSVSYPNRNCLFPDENDDHFPNSMFKEFSQTNCIMDCAIKRGIER